MSGAPLRIANSSGFYGDRFAAPREMLEGGAIDVLTGDYLSELTMLILWKGRRKDPSAGFAATFLAQMEDVLPLALQQKVRIVSNAGGLNPRGLAQRVRDLAQRMGLTPGVAVVEGDDLLDRLPELQAAGEALAHMDDGRPLSESSAPPLTANAYLGGWGITRALSGGADVVICGRVADASLVSGPAAERFGWSPDDWDALAGAVAAGHLLECGTQVTGGNYAFFREVPGLEHPGFPLAELFPDGSCIVTKHPGTGGLVSAGTVTAQLLYEIGGPRYVHPDVVARFDTLKLEDLGHDRVRVWGARGEPAPRQAKVSITAAGGFRNAITFVLTGLDADAKAELLTRTLRRAARGVAMDTRVLGAGGREDPSTAEDASTLLTVSVRDADPRKVGRAFTGAAVELALASYPGLYVTAPPAAETEYGVFWPALVDASHVRQRVQHPDGLVEDVAWPPGSEAATHEAPRPHPTAAPEGGTRRAPLGLAFGARSGDKGGNANVGVWARSPEGYAWLVTHLTAARFQELLPETAALAVRRHDFPNLLALNFVVVGLLGDGAAASPRLDPQAKALGEHLRARLVDLPESLLA